MVRNDERYKIAKRTLPPELKRWMEAFLDYLAIQNYSMYTVRERRCYIELFLVWGDARGVARLEQISTRLLESYQRYLFYYRQDNGRRLTVTAQRARLLPLRSWFQWLRKQQHLPNDPSLDLRLPKRPHRLPRGVLTTAEIERIMVCPDVASLLGLRDRAILELLYSTAMRRTELAKLSIHDLDTERRSVSIWSGKGDKDRVVPVGKRALSWLLAYIDNARPSLLVDRRETTLFLTRNGLPFVANALSDLVRKYVKAAGVSKGGSCHLLRHTAATLMLENGADVRHIQELLGHSQLSTTQIYTHVSIAELRKAHDRTHPAERDNGQRKYRRPGDDDDGDLVGVPF